MPSPGEAPPAASAPSLRPDPLPPELDAREINRRWGVPPRARWAELQPIQSRRGLWFGGYVLLGSLLALFWPDPHPASPRGLSLGLAAAATGCAALSLWLCRHARVPWRTEDRTVMWWASWWAVLALFTAENSRSPFWEDWAEHSWVQGLPAATVLVFLVLALWRVWTAHRPPHREAAR